MIFLTSKIDSGISDESFQDLILPQVSRTFALTIPQLPRELREAVTSAYLCCRIADTIEDEPALSPTETFTYLRRFAATMHGDYPAERLAAEVAPRLSDRTLPGERELVRNMDRVMRVIPRLDERYRASIQRCVEVMCSGMHEFQTHASVAGLPRSSDLDSYCYYVAGVVGEMLTEMFCAHSAAIRQRAAALKGLARSFGQGLQMTNILKDVWEDRSRGACWLPQDVFSRHGVDLATLSPERIDHHFHEGLCELVGVAHRHLRNALAFTLLVPPVERGIRCFCLWAIGLAVLTLRRICGRPWFNAGAQVKISHSAVAAVFVATNLTVRNDQMLISLFERAARNLPLAPPTAMGSSHGPALAGGGLAAQESTQ
jgi:farnesyl-diphosphate farnesyltransferase